MKDVPYIEVDADEHKEEFKKVTERSMQFSVPQTVLPSGKVIVGYNIPLMTKELL